MQSKPVGQDMQDEPIEKAAAVGAEQSTGRTLGQVDTSFFIIGIGASAGGLEAIKKFLSAVPEGFPHTLVIVQHISPDYKSMMPDILSRETWLPVHEVEDDMAVEPGKIYLIPPRSNIVIQGTRDDTSVGLEDLPLSRMPGEARTQGLRFSLTRPTRRPALNLPIDVFFGSLAEAVGNRAIAVVLSGTGSDGSRGIRAVKDHDGFVLVQDPLLAGFDGMPRTAIATGMADAVLPAEEMIPEFERYLELREKSVTEPAPDMAEGKTFREILKLVGSSADIDFASYKTPTLIRRVSRRMALRNHPTPESYLEELRTDATEVGMLSREFLVGVTNFFRDLPVWMTFRERVLPRIFGMGDREAPVRVWCAGCSTGEEAFTLAFLLEQYRHAHGIQREFRIYASDANAAAIATAKKAAYSDSVLEEIPAEFHNRTYLELMENGFRIAPTIRTHVVFAEHNVVESPPYTRTDLISCRNMLIYLSPDAQAKVITQFSFSLRKGGLLLLGAAETPGQHGSMFKPVVPRMRIFENQRVAENRREGISNLMEYAMPTGMKAPRSRRPAPQDRGLDSSLLKLMTLALKETQMAVCVVDSGARMIRSFGDVSGLLNFPSEGYSPYLLELVDERLRSAVMLTIRRAQAENVSHRPGLRLVDSDVTRIVDVSSHKIEWQPEGEVFAVAFVFRDEAPLRPVMAGTAAADMPQDAYLEHLENEVQALQDMLSATAEDLGASNEELKTANEELTAANEELQATNEETQSINEELHTVNAEHLDRINELESAYADIENLLATADIGVLLLSGTLRVRRYNAGILPFIDMESSPMGQSLENITTALPNDAVRKLRDDARIALEEGLESGREFQRMDGGWVNVRTRPFYNADALVVGVVITIRDITNVRLLEFELREYRDRLDVMLASELAGYFDWGTEPGACFLSPRLKAALGYGPHAIPDTLAGWKQLIAPEDLGHAQSAVADYLDGLPSMAAEAKQQPPLAMELRLMRANGERIWFQVRGAVIARSPGGQPTRVSGIITEIETLKGRERILTERDDAARRHALLSALELSTTLQALGDAGRASEAESAQAIGDLRRDLSQQAATILSHLDLDAQALMPASQDVISLFQSAVRRREAMFLGTNTTVRYGDTLPVSCARVTLLQVMDDLIVTLLESLTPTVTRRMAITCSAPADTSDPVTVRISVAAGAAVRLTEPARARNDRLAAVQRLVTLMGGTCTVTLDAEENCAVLVLPAANRL